MTYYHPSTDLSQNGLDPTRHDEAGFCANMQCLGYTLGQAFQAYRYFKDRWKTIFRVPYPVLWAKEQVEKGCLRLSRSEMEEAVVSNRLWAEWIVTRWTNLEHTKPDVWQKELTARRQLAAGMSELKMYAGSDFRSVPYRKAKYTFQALVKENLKEMGFGT